RQCLLDSHRRLATGGPAWDRDRGREPATLAFSVLRPVPLIALEGDRSSSATTRGPANGPPRLSLLRDRHVVSLSAGHGRCQRSELRERCVFDPFLFDPEFDPDT